MVPKVDLIFAISAVSSNADEVFQKIKETITSIIDRYGTMNIRYAMIFLGSDDVATIDFDYYTTSEQLKNLITNLDRLSGDTALDEALKAARSMFKSPGARDDAQKVLVVITDKKSASSLSKVLPEANMLEDMDVKVIPVGIGSEIERKELEEITPNVTDVITTSSVDDPEQLGKDIMVKVLKGTNCLSDQNFLLLINHILTAHSFVRVIVRTLFFLYISPALTSMFPSDTNAFIYALHRI